MPLLSLASDLRTIHRLIIQHTEFRAEAMEPVADTWGVKSKDAPSSIHDENMKEGRACKSHPARLSTTSEHPGVLRKLQSVAPSTGGFITEMSLCEFWRTPMTGPPGRNSSPRVKLMGVVCRLHEPSFTPATASVTEEA